MPERTKLVISIEVEVAHYDLPQVQQDIYYRRWNGVIANYLREASNGILDPRTGLANIKLAYNAKARTT